MPMKGLKAMKTMKALKRPSTGKARPIQVLVC